jgi:soluble lytic murein transglycosylase-like protein
VSYQRTPDSLPVTAHYLPPSCSVYPSGRKLASIPDFHPPDDTVRLINQLASHHNLNPNYIAGLIAQESAFNPQAVSFKKAIGLTQITTLGAADVVKDNPQWPRYPGIEEMPFALVKLGVIDGAINSSTEWRLNPALSIQGGVDYLNTLADYWNRPERKGQIERNLGGSSEAFSEVILASYNSGSTRVSQALDQLGAQWLEDEQLNEARSYVHRVVSYCDHFENQGDGE